MTLVYPSIVPGDTKVGIATNLILSLLPVHGAAEDFVDANPVLAAGRPGVELDTGRVKFGDGTTAWNALGYVVGDITGAESEAQLQAVLGDILAEVIDTVVTTGGAPAQQLGNAIMAAAAAADDGPAVTLLARFGAIEDSGARAEALGQMFAGASLTEGPVNPGETVSLNELGLVTGYGFGSTSVEDIVLGTGGLLPPDPESLRTVRDYADISGDIVAGTPDTLEVDITLAPNAEAELAGDTEVKWTELPAGAIGQGFVATLVLTNGTGSTVTVTPDLGGTGLATVVPYNGFGADIDIAAGETATLWLVVMPDGTLALSSTAPT